MFRDRIFRISFLFSSAWHLFWILAVSIVIAPNVQPGDIYQEVDFLGPILEKTAFDIMAEKVTPHAETHYARTAMFAEGFFLKPKGPERRVLTGFGQSVFTEKLNLSIKDLLKEPKETPVYFAEDIRMIYAERGNNLMGSFIEGPAESMQIIFKPKEVTVPRGLYGDAAEYTVRLKFLVSDNGLVYNVEPMVSSGYPEVDLVAIRSLKTWRFSPRAQKREAGAPWGMVTLKVNAK